MVRSYRLPETLAPTVTPTARLSERVRTRPANRSAAHRLTPSQLAAIRDAMRLFVEDDVAKGLSLQKRLYCDACERVRPAAGFIQYERYSVCNACAIEYEVARARGLTATAGQYVRDKHFGEADHYVVEAVASD